MGMNYVRFEDVGKVTRGTGELEVCIEAANPF
jgi:hypothetical protein